MPKKATVQKIPLEPWEVGAELLDILSRGLYSDARDAVREYVQNGVDAGAKRITISSSGPVLTIRDDGSGMDWDTLRQARRFGLSDKTPWETVGYRGIGIYASFGMCERLVISTRRAGMTDLISLRLNFGPMRETLDRDRSATRRFGLALTELLNEHSDFVREDWTGDANDQFTLVRMEGILPPYRAQINDPSGLSSYLLNTIPVAYPDESYGQTANFWLHQELELNPVHIELRIGEETPFAVAPPIAEGVLAPEKYWLCDEEGKKLAFVWYALTGTKDRITNPKGTTDSGGVSGFLLKIKGFTLGDRTTLKHLWPSIGGGILYHHYTGEIHVCESSRVFPNAARNNLEAGPDTQTFLKHLREYFRELNSRADVSRDVLRIRDRLAGMSDAASALGKQRDDPEADQFELYRQGRNSVEELDKLAQDVKRLQSGRKAGHLSVEQAEGLVVMAQTLSELKRDVSAIIQVANKRTSGAKTRAADAATVPPETAWLAKAKGLLDDWLVKEPNDVLAVAAGQMNRVIELRILPAAVAILDELKASGLTLPADLESCRRELRLLLGWSPSSPVSLRDALTEGGISPTTDREEAFVHGFDRGLIGGLGGRGQAYEVVLRAVAESLAEEDALQ